MGFSYEFGADSGKLADAVTSYNGIKSDFNDKYTAAKPQIEALKNSLVANGNEAEWQSKIQRVLDILEKLDQMFEKNSNNLGQISSRVSEMATKMQSAVANM